MFQRLRAFELIILEEARKCTEIDLYMPDMNEYRPPNRDYVVNIGKRERPKLWSLIVNTLLPECLKDMVDEALEVKNENIPHARK